MKAKTTPRTAAIVTRGLSPKAAAFQSKALAAIQDAVSSEPGTTSVIVVVTKVKPSIIRIVPPPPPQVTAQIYNYGNITPRY